MTEHEELLKLRALVEKQAAELATKNQIIEAQNSQIEKQNDKIEKQNARIEKQNIQSAACEDIKASFFHYSRTRNGDIAMGLLEEFDGYLITDGYAGYEKVKNITRSLCWSHARRYFIESIPLDSKGKEISGSKGAEGRGLRKHQHFIPQTRS